ncbi:MAG: glycosyltransferase family 4 protein [Candidatus Hydrogenedentes bacterium]|nr:glycosyltransferase family 4 protein [Candidatus Hydrogenedentota bacterium]
MKTVLITPHICRPWPLSEGGGPQRTMLMRNALRQFGEVCVVVATPCTDGSSQERREVDGLQQIFYDAARETGMFRALQLVLRGDLRRVAKNLAIYSADFSLADRSSSEQLRRIIREFQPELVVCRLLPWAVATGAAFINDVPVILDFDDVDWRVHESRVEQMAEHGAVRRLHGRLVRQIVERNARKCLRRFAHVFVASEEDRSVVGLQSCSVLPNVPILPEADGGDGPGESSNEPSILFVGSLGNPRNAQGLDHFLDHVWPDLHRAAPDLKLRLVGPLPDDESASVARWRKMPNVEVVGLVEDIGVEYERALFTVAPVYWGGGTKVKVLETLGRGRTCVLTPHAVYGLGHYVKHGDSLLCAETDAEFVQCCLKLVKSDSLRRSLATRGRKIIREHFSIARFNSAVARVVARFAEAHQGVGA